MPSWVFDIVDANGLTQTEAGLTPQALSLTYQRGSAPTIADAQISLKDPIAGIISREEEATYYLKGYWQPDDATPEDRVLRFYGEIWVDEIQASENGSMLQITAFDQLATLSKRFTEAQFTPDDMGDLIMQMVDTTNSTDGETGIETSASYITASSSVDLDARTNRPTILSVMQQFAATQDGPECWIDPIEYTAGKIGRLYISPSRGTNQAEAVFGFGEGTEGNTTSMSRTRDKTKVENVVNGYADTLTVEQRSNLTSQNSLGTLVGWQAYTGETSQTNLGTLTQGRLTERDTLAKTAEYKCSPAENAPRLFEDFNIGDTVTLDYREEEIEWTVTRRVASAKLVIDQAGRQTAGEIEFIQ